MRSERRILTTAAIVLVAAASPSAWAQDAEAVKKMTELGRQASADYDAGDFESARIGLLEAVTVGSDAGLGRHPAMVRTYLQLAAVYANGVKDRTRASKYMSLALKADPNLSLPKGLDTPAMKALHAELAKPAAAPAPAAPKPAAPAAAPRPEPAPVPAAPAVVAKAAPEPGSDEPDLPATIPQALYCPNPDEAPPEEAIALRCVTQPGFDAARVLLFYRTAGVETFTAARAIRSPKGWYTAVIPAEAAVGKSLQYYFEARDGSDQAVANAGRSDSPNLLLIREGAPPVNEQSLASARAADAGEGNASDGEEDPLTALARTRAAKARAAKIHRRGAGAFFIGLGVGSGYGWHQVRKLEFRDDREVAQGFSPSGLVSAQPEIGYHVTDALSVSVQLRSQFIRPEGSGDTMKAGAPAKGALAVLGRVQWFVGEGNAQLVLSGALGGGDGFRLTVPPREPQLPRHDTVRGGPIVFGPGVGGIYHFSRHVAVAVEARGLAGVPDFALLGDLGASLQLGF